MATDPAAACVCGDAECPGGTLVYDHDSALRPTTFTKVCWNCNGWPCECEDEAMLDNEIRLLTEQG